MGNFLKICFTPLVYVQNDQCVMGIILRHLCWGTHYPPPPPQGPAAADGRTHLPPPPLDPPPGPQKFSDTVGCQYSNRPPPSGCTQ